MLEKNIFVDGLDVDEYADTPEKKKLTKDETIRYLEETLSLVRSGVVLAAQRTRYENFGQHIILEVVLE